MERVTGLDRQLWIDPAQGFSGDMFAAALIGLGVPEQGLIGALEASGAELGLLNSHTHVEFLPDDTLGYRLHLLALRERDAPAPRLYLDSALKRAGVGGAYAALARRALTILLAAGQRTRAAAASPQRTVSLPVVGVAHTPYQHEAPYQPAPGQADDDVFYVEMEPGYEVGLSGLETFSHIFIISYLDRTSTPEMQVQPPWRDEPEQYGVFATRSPNRPSLIGLTRTRLRRVVGNRVYTGPLDLFDGTPVLDIKPFIHSLDGATEEDDIANDGWLAGSEHLELHRRGIPHTHPGSAGHLDDVQVIVATLTGVAWGLQHLAVDVDAVTCLSPVYVGQPAPATQAILEERKIPSEAGPGKADLLTPLGAALLAALAPAFAPRTQASMEGMQMGVGLGQHTLEGQPVALRLYTLSQDAN